MGLPMCSVGHGHTGHMLKLTEANPPGTVHVPDQHREKL